jgi:hypothetical protein
MCDDRPRAALPARSVTVRTRPLPEGTRAFLGHGIERAWLQHSRRLQSAADTIMRWLRDALPRARGVLLLLPISPSSSITTGGPSRSGAGESGDSEWVALLLAIVCTLVIVALFLAPAWLPDWRRWRAMCGRRRRARSSTAKEAAQRFAEAVSRGDFEVAETEAERLLKP